MSRRVRRALMLRAARRTLALLSAAVLLAAAACDQAAAQTAGPLSTLRWNRAAAQPGWNLWATYQASANATVTFSIVNAAGQRVRDLGDNVPEAPGQHWVDWDGYSDAALRVPDGIYQMVLDAAYAGGGHQTLSAPITIDTVPPSIRIVNRKLGRSTRLVVAIADLQNDVRYAVLKVRGRIVARAGGGATQLGFTPLHHWKPGVTPVTATVVDRAGNSASATRIFRIGAKRKRRK